MTPSPHASGTMSMAEQTRLGMLQPNVPEPKPTGMPQALLKRGDDVAPAPVNSVAKKIDPRQLFEQHLKDAKDAGIQISSQVQKRGTRKVVFKDGGKLMLSKDGLMIHKYADGKKVQCTPDGKLTTVRSTRHIRCLLPLLSLHFFVVRTRACALLFVFFF